MWCNHGGAHVRPCFFHSRTQNRHLKDNDSGLDKSNYDLRPIPSETEEIGVKLGKNKNTTKRFFGQSKDSICLENNAGRMLFQIS